MIAAETLGVYGTTGGGLGRREADPGPYYLPVGNEIEIFEAAWQKRLAVMLKGPTGCGKTRFVEAMAHRLGRPLITVPGHEDLTAADLIGRYVLQGGDTVWVDGPVTQAVREGGICYLDEIVEARQDTTVILHPLSDHRRELNLDRCGAGRLPAADGFCLVLSYNPGYQSILKDLKVSTRQRMVAIEFGFPPAAAEVEILVHETGVSREQAERLVGLGQAIRRLTDSGLREVASTRTLIAAASLIDAGLSPREAAVAAIVMPLSDDSRHVEGLVTMVQSYLPEATGTRRAG